MTISNTLEFTGNAKMTANILGKNVVLGLLKRRKNRVQGRGFQDKNLSVNTTYTEENYFQGIHLQCSLRSLVGDN